MLLRTLRRFPATTVFTLSYAVMILGGLLVAGGGPAFRALLILVVPAYVMLFLGLLAVGWLGPWAPPAFALLVCLGLDWFLSDPWV